MDIEMVGNSVFNYEIVLPLGIGGIGVVYRAPDSPSKSSHRDRRVRSAGY